MGHTPAKSWLREAARPGGVSSKKSPNRGGTLPAQEKELVNAMSLSLYGTL